VKGREGRGERGGEEREITFRPKTAASNPHTIRMIAKAMQKIIMVFIGIPNHSIN
jgi:hypothetical protein